MPALSAPIASFIAERWRARRPAVSQYGMALWASAAAARCRPSVSGSASTRSGKERSRTSAMRACKWACAAERNRKLA